MLTNLPKPTKQSTGWQFGNHPCLTKDGWKNATYLKASQKIAVVEEGSLFRTRGLFVEGNIEQENNN